MKKTPYTKIIRYCSYWAIGKIDKIPQEIRHAIEFIMSEEGSGTTKEAVVAYMLKLDHNRGIHGHDAMKDGYPVEIKSEMVGWNVTAATTKKCSGSQVWNVTSLEGALALIKDDPIVFHSSWTAHGQLMCIHEFLLSKSYMGEQILACVGKNKGVRCGQSLWPYFVWTRYKNPNMTDDFILDNLTKKMWEPLDGGLRLSQLAERRRYAHRRAA